MRLEPECRGISCSFFAYATVQTSLGLFRAPQFAYTEQMLAYSTMFCILSDLITVDYIMEDIEFTDNHSSISRTT